VSTDGRSIHDQKMVADQSGSERRRPLTEGHRSEFDGETLQDLMASTARCRMRRGNVSMVGINRTGAVTSRCDEIVAAARALNVLPPTDTQVTTMMPSVETKEHNAGHSSHCSPIPFTVRIRCLVQRVPPIRIGRASALIDGSTDRSRA
jgi:hypothetical protein